MTPRTLLSITCGAVIGASPATAQVDILQSAPRWTVGDADGQMAFGEITDVVVLGDDRTVVLDRAGSVLWLLNASGELVSKTGRSGRGPGEFVAPVAVDASGDRLFILDQVAGRISVFAPEDQGLRFLDAWVLPGLFHDICVVGGRLFVLGAFEGHAIHELSSDGTVIRSFDPLPDANRGDFVAQEEQGFFSSGRLVCDSGTGRVIVAPTMRRMLRAFDLSGRSVWTTALPDFHEAQLVPRGSAYGMAPDPRSGRVTQTESATIGVEGLWVQVRELSPQGGQTEGDLRSWAVDLNGGAVRELPPLPQIRAVTAGWVIAAGGSLVPQLQAWRREPR